MTSRLLALTTLAVAAGAAAAAPAVAAPVPARSACRPVAVQSFHGGKRMEAYCRLARVEHGSVPCLTLDAGKPGRCRFTTNSGRWLRSTSGAMYARAGQRISRLGAPGGNRVIASPAGKAPCVEDPKPKARLSDAAGTATGYELGWQCTVEVMLSSSNATGLPLRNYATQEVCSTTHGSPDQANAIFTRSPEPGVFCYRGEGAGLNDPNGTERDITNRYLPGWQACHIVWSGGYEVFAAKRPATRNWPAPGRVDWNTPIVWRPVTSVRVAN
jgi:hypothetical protein